MAGEGPVIGGGGGDRGSLSPSIGPVAKGGETMAEETTAGPDQLVGFDASGSGAAATASVVCCAVPSAARACAATPLPGVIEVHLEVLAVLAVLAGTSLLKEGVQPMSSPMPRGSASISSSLASASGSASSICGSSSYSSRSFACVSMSEANFSMPASLASISSWITESDQARGRQGGTSSADGAVREAPLKTSSTGRTGT
mmetsp:Transcript_64232/g.139746  ORF Transcript_64232/g.139746 Transcript_64232/m.139746 type:complete len:201 (+) Transcript_64232:685-1287(+)